MRKYFYLAYDLACICGTLVAALYLRHGFPLIQEGSPSDLYVLLLVTLGTALCVLLLMGTHTGIWRFTSSSELTSIMIAVALIVVVTNSFLFLISRLDMMPRSVPPMHWALAVVAMSGSRLLARRLFGRFFAKTQSMLKQHVIVVGACPTAEFYLQFVRRIVRHPVVVEGFVDSNPTLTHRLFQKHKILGTPAHLPRIIEELLVHGIHVRQVVLAQLIDDLPPAERELLLAMEQSGLVEMVHFGKYISPHLQPEPVKNTDDFYQNIDAIAASDYEKPAGMYPYVKRAFDVVAGVVLVAVLSPVIALTALLVALDVGLPVLFWQQRPGFHGKPFRLYKFRTMRTAGRRLSEDRRSHKSADHTRTSAIGKWLRHLRLDELPQLFHVIAGTMSFVGPRPLLPDDQPSHGEMRLSVRPGVTGWAQIHGGDALTPEEKLILDVWYIRHLSFWLDLRILLRSLLVVLKEDTRKTAVTEQTKKGPASV